MTTPQQITMELLKGNSVVIDPIQETVELALRVEELGRMLNKGTATDKTTTAFFADQEKQINDIKATYYNHVIQSGLADARTSKGNVFEKFDFKLVITPKT